MSNVLSGHISGVREGTETRRARQLLGSFLSVEDDHSMTFLCPTRLVLHHLPQGVAAAFSTASISMFFMVVTHSTSSAPQSLPKPEDQLEGITAVPHQPRSPLIRAWIAVCSISLSPSPRLVPETEVVHKSNLLNRLMHRWLYVREPVRCVSETTRDYCTLPRSNILVL